MTSGNNTTFRKAVLHDLDAIKALADRHRTELGFVLRPSLQESIVGSEIIVAFRQNSLIGFVHYHHRQDQQTTLYHLAVNPHDRMTGIGRGLISSLCDESIAAGKSFILLKCPVTLTSNRFYERVGFVLARTETGKERALNVWQFRLPVTNV